MARWSLRTKLVAVAALAFLPVLVLSGWRAYSDARDLRTRRAEAASAVAEAAFGRHRELLESSRRLLTAACADDAVQSIFEASPDIDRCDAYLARLIQRFPSDYSALLVIDNTGVARCASAPAARGMNFADRETYKTVQKSGTLAVGSHVASRVTPSTIVPMALPLVRDGKVRGMCAIGLSLRGLAEQLGSPQSAGSAGVALVDRGGAPLGGDPRATAALPVASRVADVIASGQTTFSEYGQNGAVYDFSI